MRGSRRHIDVARGRGQRHKRCVLRTRAVGGLEGQLGKSRAPLDVTIRGHIVLLANQPKRRDVQALTSILQRQILQQAAVDVGRSVMADENDHQDLLSIGGHPQTSRVKLCARRPIYPTVHDHLKLHNNSLPGRRVAAELPQSRREGVHRALGAEQLHQLSQPPYSPGQEQTILLNLRRPSNVK